MIRVALAGLLLVSSAAPSVATDDWWGVAIFPSGAEFSLEIADDLAEQRLGYMFREQVAPYEGMLFVYPVSGHYSIWMKNCKVSLDIIWMDERLRVVHVAREQPPCPPEGECPSILPLRAARYVLEVAAGRAAAEGLQLGDRIVVHTDPPLPR